MNQKTLIRPFELKATDKTGVFEGYGSVFFTIDSYRDVVMPGAFADSIAEHKAKGTAPALLWQHNHYEPIGRYTDFEEDEKGLFLRGELFINDHVPMADKCYTLFKRKAIKGLSIGFNVASGGEEWDDEARVNRLTKVDLWETSPVTFPANPDAEVTAVKQKLGAGTYPTVREFERLLVREAGFTRSDAHTILTKGFHALIKSVAGDDHEDNSLNLKPAANEKELHEILQKMQSLTESLKCQN